jgi:Family of unknown function (DUF6461)
VVGDAEDFMAFKRKVPIMPGPEDDLPVSEWEWLGSDDIRIVGSLMFARKVSAERIIEAFGVDPATARLVSADGISGALSHPLWDEAHPWIRAGTFGDWGFALSLTDFDMADRRDNMARRLSSGTEVAVVAWTEVVDTFQYWEDGVMVTLFEPLLAADRSGSEPDRFLAEMREARLETERSDPQEDASTVQEPEQSDPIIAVLDMLTRALGIRLPAEVALGPLLTVQRG